MDIEEKILDILNNEDKIILAESLPDEYKKEILKLEMKRLNEMIPLINKGLQEAFEKEQSDSLTMEEFHLARGRLQKR